MSGDRIDTLNHEILPFAGRFGRNALLVGALVFFGGPLVWLMLAATKTPDQITGGVPLSFGSFAQVGHAWNHLMDYQDGIMLTWLRNSTVYAVSSVALSLGTALPAGYALAKYRFPARRAILFATLITMLVPSAALILPLYIEFSTFGLLNTAWSVILPLGFFPFGVYLVYLYTTTNIPDSLIEASRLDGCSDWHTFTKIFLPLARPVIALVGFFAFVACWNNYFLPYIMLTGTEKLTVQTGLNVVASTTPGLFGPGGFNNNVQIYQGELALATLISILPILAVFLFAQRYLVGGQLVAAEKG
jgi:multiple sugar transport system permease protein